MSEYHVSVMLREVMDALNVKKGGTYLDATLGGGGHTSGILSLGGKVVAIDRDDDAIEYCKSHLSGDVTYIKGTYENAKQLLSERGIASVSGSIMDLGISSHQVDVPERGFSYMQDGYLDMRMDRSSTLTAADVVNTYSRDELYAVIRRYGEEDFAGRIVSAIERERSKEPITRTLKLAELICKATPYRKSGHPAKKTFQALRIEVNGELKNLYSAIVDIFSLVERGGRLCVISFHSLEDRIVKAAFKEFATDCVCPKELPICVCGHKAIGKTIVRQRPTAEELNSNPRAKSATLRVIEKQ